MMGFQAAGAAPIVAGHPIENPETIATAIRIGNPASWYGATSAASESGGGIAAVDGRLFVTPPGGQTCERHPAGFPALRLQET